MEIIRSINKPRLILDFDGTVVNSIKRICEMYHEDFGEHKYFTPIEWCDINTWEFKELSLADKKYLDNLWNQPRFFNNLEFMDNAEEVLPIMAEEFDIEIATMGEPDNLSLKNIWIPEHMPYVKKIHLIDIGEYPDKSHIDMSNATFADDNTKYLMTSNAKLKICFGDVYDWNKEWDRTRCYNWYEVMAELMLDD